MNPLELNLTNFWCCCWSLWMEAWPRIRMKQGNKHLSSEYLNLVPLVKMNILYGWCRGLTSSSLHSETWCCAAETWKYFSQYFFVSPNLSFKQLKRLQHFDWWSLYGKLETSFLLHSLLSQNEICASFNEVHFWDYNSLQAQCFFLLVLSSQLHNSCADVTFSCYHVWCCCCQCCWTWSWHVPAPLPLSLLTDCSAPRERDCRELPLLAFHLKYYFIIIENNSVLVYQALLVLC